MQKRSFWTGFLSGSLVAVIAIVLLVRSLLVQPDVTLTNMQVQDLDGRKVDLINNKPLVVNYWATWCMPCIREFPDFQKVIDRYGDKVNFVMVSDEDSDLIRTFKNRKPFTFTYLRAIKGFEDISTRPTTFIYNKKGELIEKFTGSMDAAKLTTILQKLEF